MSGTGVDNITAANAAVRPSTHVTTSSWQYHTPLSSTNNHHIRRTGKNEVIVIHDDSSEPDIPMSAALYPLPVASQIHHRQDISNNGKL